MKVKSLVLISLFTAIIVILGIFPPICFPIIPVPLVIQNSGPMLAGILLGSKKGLLSTLLFLFLVVLGFPFLSGGRGGLGMFFMPTAGFILSWLLVAYVTGFLVEKSSKKTSYLNLVFIMIFGGIFINYFFGILWLKYFSKLSFKKSIQSCLIFIPGDLIKILLVAKVSNLINKHYSLIDIK